MRLDFEKYHGNGNDFIIINNMNGDIFLTQKEVQHLCHRQFGIGADGLMLIQPGRKTNFEMQYYNSNGLPGTMCGNGGRCIAAYAFAHKLADRKILFSAVDGLHKAVINDVKTAGILYDVSLQMAPVSKVAKNANSYFLDTGSPHHVEFVKEVDEIDVFNRGRNIRNSKRYLPGGTNVNFVQITDDTLYVRTYERGVEEETLSCGTGVTASALAAFLETGKKNRRIKTRGGNFSVNFEGTLPFTDIWLQGPAQLIFKGITEL